MNRTDRLDDTDEPQGLVEALADARARPWRYRLNEKTRGEFQFVFHVLDGRSGPLYEHVTRALALDEEARRAGQRHTA